MLFSLVTVLEDRLCSRFANLVLFSTFSLRSLTVNTPFSQVELPDGIEGHSDVVTWEVLAEISLSQVSPLLVASAAPTERSRRKRSKGAVFESYHKSYRVWFPCHSLQLTVNRTSDWMSPL